MSKFEQFFSAGGGSSYLGVPYPKASTEYKEVGNVGLAGTSPTQSHAVLASRLPVRSDPNKHLSIHASGDLILGRNMGTGAIIWSLTQVSLNGSWTAMWVNPVNDDVYIFIDYNRLSGRPIFTKITLGATMTTIFSSTTLYGTIGNSANNYNGAYLAPRDPLNPDTCIWDVVGDGGTAANPFLNHLAIDASNNTAVVTKLTVGTVPKMTVMAPVQYVTADRKIILGGWSRAQESDYAIGFFVTRGSITQYVEIPTDGNLPLPNISFPNLARATVSEGAPHPARAALSAFLANIKIIVMGQSVFFALQNNADFDRITGKRLFDRVDFDRWLTAVCDAHNMPTGVGYF